MTIVLTVDRGSEARSAFREGREVLRPDVVVDVEGLGKNAYFAVSTAAVLKNKKTVVYLGGSSIRHKPRNWRGSRSDAPDRGTRASHCRA
jgi:hypothetical protein